MRFCLGFSPNLNLYAKYDMQACVCKGPPWRSRAKLAAVLLAVGVGSVTALHVPLEQVIPG